jgi:hypothetical protein
VKNWLENISNEQTVVNVALGYSDTLVDLLRRCCVAISMKERVVLATFNVTGQ